MDKSLKNQKYYYDVEIKKAKFNKAAMNYIDPGEDYLPYASENKHIGSNFDDFANESDIELKRDMNWAIKMLEHGKIVYREDYPNVILFPIGQKNNPETSLTVDDLFAEDWMIFRGKTLKEVLDDLYAGKTIRRKSWYPEHGIGIYSKDFQLDLQDLKAHDWESIDIVAEVNKIQQDIKDGNAH